MYSVKNNIIYLNLQKGGMNISGYKNKYIRYKLKYIKLRQQLGGNTIDEDIATYRLLDNLEVLDKLEIIKYASEIVIIQSLIVSLEEHDDPIIMQHANAKIIELQEGVAPQVVAQQVVAQQVVAQPAYNPSRNPGINRAPPTIPGTQSQFYMPLISEAYYLAREQPVPQQILDAGCGVINLGDIISPATYNRMVTALADHLRQNGNIALLTRDYELDNHFPTDHSVGHIDGDAQEALLERPIFEGLPLVIKLEAAIVTHYGR